MLSGKYDFSKQDSEQPVGRFFVDKPDSELSRLQNARLKWYVILNWRTLLSDRSFFSCDVINSKIISEIQKHMLLKPKLNHCKIEENKTERLNEK